VCVLKEHLNQTKPEGFKLSSIAGLIVIGICHFFFFKRNPENQQGRGGA